LFHNEPVVEKTEILIVDDDRAIRTLLRKWLELEGYAVHEFDDGQAMLDTLDTLQPHAICLDIMMPRMDGLETLRRLSEKHSRVPVIILSAKDMVDTAVNAMRLGAFDYQLKPVDRERLLLNIKNATRTFELEQKVKRLETEVRQQHAFSNIIGHAPKMKTIFQQMERLLASTIPVYVSGESGTGKELVARAIHYNGVRRDGPFVELNCAAISETLLESELFGHEKGAFTGAVAAHKGKFEQAHGGTLFLDEIGEVSPSVQARLLRVLQEGTLQRLGGVQTISVDVRIISATHRDIEAMVRDAKFREDLFYRLVVYSLSLPPLRDRLEDVPELAEHFLRKHAQGSGRGERSLSAESLDVLSHYEWPGNVRELENVIRRALIASDGDMIGLDALPEKILQHAMKSVPALQGFASGAKIAEPREVIPLEALEREAIEHAVSTCEGNITIAAKKLGIGRTTLYRKMLAYKLATPESEVS
jgi:DNA-binding NtrC family response regulator